MWEPLELLLCKALSHHSDAKYQAPVLWKRNQCSQVMYNFSSPQIMHVKRSDQIVHLKSILKKKRMITKTEARMAVQPCNPSRR